MRTKDDGIAALQRQIKEAKRLIAEMKERKEKKIKLTEYHIAKIERLLGSERHVVITLSRQGGITVWHRDGFEARAEVGRSHIAQARRLRYGQVADKLVGEGVISTNGEIR